MHSNSARFRSRSRSFLLAIVALAAPASTLAGCWIEDIGTATPAQSGKSDASPDKKKDKRNGTADGGARDAGARASIRDGGSPSPSLGDATLDVHVEPLCAGPIQAGDLRIVEILVDSIAGTGDKGEWIEIENARSCTVNLDGVRVSSPRVATAADEAIISGTTLLPPGERFIVASSTSGAVNGGLPGLVVAFAGNGSDFLDGYQDLIMVQAGQTLVDLFTYDLIGLSIGTPYAFPEMCAESLRKTVSSWKVSRHAWSPGKFGTPNAPNDDVACN